jgi:hypothetical protein
MKKLLFLITFAFHSLASFTCTPTDYGVYLIHSTNPKKIYRYYNLSDCRKVLKTEQNGFLCTKARDNNYAILLSKEHIIKVGSMLDCLKSLKASVKDTSISN